MAPSTFIKSAGVLALLLLGLTNITVVSNETPTTTTTSSPVTSTAGATTTSSSSVTSTSGATTTATSTSGATTTATSTSGATTTATSTSGATTTATSTSGATTTATSTSGATTTTSSSVTSTTGTAGTTMGSNSLMTSNTSGASTTGSITSTSGDTRATITASTSTSASTTTTNTMTSHSVSSATSSLYMNETTSNATSNMSQIYCPSFSCNHSDCYMMYNSRNFTPCGAGEYCRLRKHMGMHTVGCSGSCADNCTTWMTNCSVTCCNFTGCLNGSFASMMHTTTVTPMTQTTTTTATTTTSSPQTTVNNGNKCYKGTCTDTDCYTTFKNTAAQICSSTEKHCQLKKDTVDSKVQWSAGCTANCSTQTPCKASTQPPCHLECCNATMTSCLWLNGTLNFPSSATRGPYLHTGVLTFLLCLFTSTLML